MRSRDWSSDVCSSDLSELGVRDAQFPAPLRHPVRQPLGHGMRRIGRTLEWGFVAHMEIIAVAAVDVAALRHLVDDLERVAGIGFGGLSEERSVGKGCFSTCHSLWSPYL